MAEAALQDCVGTVVEGRHVAASADPDALRSRSSGQLLVRSGVVPGHRMSFISRSIFLNKNLRFLIPVVLHI